MPRDTFTGFAAQGSSSSGVSGNFPTSLQNTWSLITLVYNGTTLSVYQDGALVKPGTIAAVLDNNQPLAIGNDANGDDPGYAAGAFDECRLRRGAASADWVAASHATQSSSSFLAYGTVGCAFGDDVLEVCGVPDGVGAPAPDYGVLRGLDAGDTVSLSMAVTNVPGGGGVLHRLTGWRLYAVDRGTGDKTLLRSSEESGEAFDACAYVHASRAEFQWLWRTFNALAVQAPVVDRAADSTADVSVTVDGIGYTAASATLTVLYGNMPARLDFTNVVATALVNPETFTATLTRLNPLQTYYAKAILETDTGERVESATVSFTTSATADGPCDPGITATESFVGGQLQAINFTFESSDADRDFYVAYGPAHGGNDPAGWTYTNLLGTITAGTTDYNYLIPDDWGSDSNLVVRFYFGDGLVEWSKSFYWRDYTVPITASSAPAMVDTRTRMTMAPAVLTALDTRSHTEAWSIRPVYATQTTPVPVPYAWLDGFEGLVVGGDYEAAANATAANGVNTVWECYVLGLNPTAAGDFFLVDIAVAEGNAVISWSPDLGASRVYTIEAADTLDDPAWTEVENTLPTPDHPLRFFRVKAALP